MKRATLEKKLRQRLAAGGVQLEPGGPAERGVVFVADLGARVATSGESALRGTRDALNRAAELAREALHAATKPPPPPRRRKKK